MALDVQTEIEIGRPRAEVAEPPRAVGSREARRPS